MHKKDFPSVVFIFSFVFAKKFIIDFRHLSSTLRKATWNAQAKEGNQES